MKRAVTVFFLFLAASAMPLSSMALDLLRICYARYPGCTRYIYDYRDSTHDYNSLWCGDEFIFDEGGLGGSIGARSECVYFA